MFNRRISAIGILLALTCIVLGWAQIVDASTVFSSNIVSEKGTGTQTLTNLATSTALTIPSGTLHAIFVVRGNAARYTTDSTAATTSHGFPLLPGVYMMVNRDPKMLSEIRWICETTPCTIDVIYSRDRNLAGN